MTKERELYLNNRCPNLQFDEDEVSRFFDFIDQHPSINIPEGELSWNFVIEEEICQLHDEFFQDPSPTDVVTFPGDSEDGIAGDICVSPSYAMEYIKESEVSFSEELSLYLIHGCLHLAGLDDIKDEDRQKMREREKTLMDACKEAKVIPEFRLSIVS